jgi:hypothetical protein
MVLTAHLIINHSFFIICKEIVMKRGLLFFSLLALLSIPLQSAAQSQHEHGGKAEPGKTAAAGPMMHGNAIMLPEVVEAGVKAMVHLNDVSAMMAKMGHKENFHLMVGFTEVATGKPLSEGSVALRITGPGQDKAGEPIALMAMAGQFGSDISLPGKGAYTLEIGSKLADGTKRQFKFQYTMP